MTPTAAVSRLWGRLLSLGSYPEETETQRGRRRITVGVSTLFFGLNLVSGFGELGGGRAWLAATAWATCAAIGSAFAMLALKPRWFAGILHALFFVVSLVSLAETVFLGGVLPSSARIMWGLLVVLGALVALRMRAAIVWFAVFLLMVVLAVVLPDRIEARYAVQASTGELAVNIGGVATVAFATMAYFVRQRDRFQERSDALLHNILPNDIANRLKSGEAMIADHFESASVLFADVVAFTPLSAAMAPTEIVALLNDVFSTFDRFVEELGLEKIKTVGDEYMVAAGVPVAMPDHAARAAELALRIRDHVAGNEFGGHKLALRIGINSGPVVAGIIGTKKFAYDLWGDVVNTASRMQTEGLPGAIQVSAATAQLVGDRYICEPRGVVAVKGKGDMQTYLLVARRSDL